MIYLSIIEFNIELDYNGKFEMPNAAALGLMPRIKEYFAINALPAPDEVTNADVLLDHGADIEASGALIGGGTPLGDAVAFGQWRAARRLVERGQIEPLLDPRRRAAQRKDKGAGEVEHQQEHVHPWLPAPIGRPATL
jgi:hypothetical protein